MKKNRFTVVFSLVILLVPFLQSLFTGIVAVAETLDGQGKIQVMKNDSGLMDLNYAIDPVENTINWQYTISKNQTKTPNQFGIKLEAGEETLALNDLVSESSSFISKDQWLQELKPSGEAKTQVVSFKTKLVEDVKISTQILQMADDGSLVDVLKSQPQMLHIEIPRNTETTQSSQVESTEATSGIEGSGATSDLPVQTTTESTETTETQESTEAPTASTSTESTSTVTSESESQTTSEATTESTVTTSETSETTESTDSTTVTQEKQEQSKPRKVKAAGRDITELPGADALFDSDEGRTIFSGATLTKDGEPIDGKDIQVDDNLLLEYEWSLPEELRKNIKAGDYFDFHLPDKFVINAEQLTGNLTDSNGKVFGTFVINKDGSVRITFTDEVEKNSGITGSLNVAGKVDKNKIDGPGDEDIDIPFTDGNESETPNIVVPNTKAISKKVASKDKNEQIKDNKAHVRWEIIANQTANTMTNGVLTDYLPKGATYKGNLVVTEYDVDLATGKLIEPGKTVTITPTFDKDGNPIFTFPSPTKKAYKVAFDTEIDLDKYPDALNPDKLTAKVKNEATLVSDETGDVDASASATFGSNSKISKDGAGFTHGGDVAKWVVKFDKSGIDIPGGTTFIDKIGQGQIMTDENGKEISVEELQARLQAAFTVGDKNVGKKLVVVKNDDGSYSIQFPDGISDSFELPFYTSAKGSDHKYENSISWNGNDSTGSNTVEKPKSGVVKENDKGQNNGGTITPGQNDGIVNWTIKVNGEKTEIDSWNVVDKLTNSTWSKDPADIHVYEIVNDQEVQLSSTDYTVSDISASGFKVSYNKKKTSSTFVIKFQSTYDKDKWNMEVKNNATYNYTQGDKTWSSGDDSKFKTPGDQRNQVDGSKGGVFNALDNTITWTIKINTSHVPLGANAVLTDPIPAKNTYVDGSAKVYQADGKTEASGFTATLEDGKLVVKGFPEGSIDEYVIVFKTKVDAPEGEIAVGKTTNKAKYHDDLNKDLEVSSSVDSTTNNNYIDKKDAYDANADYSTIHYTVEVNPGKLTLKNVKLVDGSWVNVKVKPETLKIVDSAGKDVTSQFKAVFAEQQFSIEFGNITDHYTVTYDSTINFVGKPGENVPVKNKATITGDNVQKGTGSDDEELVVKVPDAGGTAQGEVRSLTIKKLDKDTDAKIEGVTLALYRGPKADGKLVATAETDQNGEAHFTGLTYDDYTLVEETPASGYFISEALKNGISVTITEKTDKEIGLVIEATNQKVGSIHLTKVDATTEEGLEGAVFKLYQADGKTQVTTDAFGKEIGEAPDHSFTTSTDGTLSIANLIPGKYILKEESAPTGYHIVNGETEVTVVSGDSEHPVEVTVENEINKGKIVLQKVGEGRNLEGAEFTLTDDDPTTKDVVKSSAANGLVSFDLEANKVYSIEETKNPVGYEGTFKIENIRVVADGKVVYGDPEVTVDTVIPIVVENDRITTEISGTKSWEIAGNDESIVVPSSITVNLLQDGEIYKTMVTNAAKGWNYSFTDLPKINVKTGNEYVYTVMDEVTGYEPTVDGNDLVNTLDTTSISGTKSWDALADEYGVIPDSIKVQLLYSDDNGNSYKPFKRDGKEVIIDVTANDNWQYTFDNLPKYNRKGDALKYRVKEVSIPGFDVEGKGDHDLHNTLQLTEVSLTKFWSDAENFYNTRPDELDFTLMVLVDDQWQTFEELFNTEKSITLSGDSSKWEGTFTELPKYDKDGQEIQYGIKEDLSGSANVYIPNNGQQGDTEQIQEVTQGGTTEFTNNLATVALTVEKTWKDFDN